MPWHPPTTLDELEARWFEADHDARAARAALTSVAMDESVRADAQSRLADAERRKRDIMRAIEATEDSLISDGCDPGTHGQPDR